jgi:hypothetical protein
MHRVHRVHFDTGAGALCGTMAVVGWTTKAANVTCRGCRARLARAAVGHAQPFTLAHAHDASSGSDAVGELAQAAASS